jgi:simple sugar transport system permease protein
MARLKDRRLQIKDRNFLRLLIIFVIVFAVCSILKGRSFLNLGNFQSMMNQFPEYGLLAVAIALALMIGGIDLSAVFLANLSAIIAGKFLLANISDTSAGGTIIVMIFVSFLVCLIIGALGGALNGFLISGLGIPQCSRRLVRSHCSGVSA